jgi:hypothetical protein
MLTSHADFDFSIAIIVIIAHGLTLFSILLLQKMDASLLYRGKSSRIAFPAYIGRVKGTQVGSQTSYIHTLLLLYISYISYIWYLTYVVRVPGCTKQNTCRGGCCYTPPRLRENIPQVLPSSPLAGLSNSVELHSLSPLVSISW